MLDFILKFFITSGVFMVAAVDTFIFCETIGWIRKKIKEKKSAKHLD